jgi:hypothetical protein
VYSVSIVLHGGLGNQLFQFFIACLAGGSHRFSTLSVCSGFIKKYKTKRELEIMPLLVMYEKFINIRNIHSNILLKLRLPKFLKYICGEEKVLYIPFHGYVMDGYFQELRFFNDYPNKNISQLLIKWRKVLFNYGLLQETSKGNLLHIRLSDFFNTSTNAKEFVRFRLINLKIDTDIVTDDEELVMEVLRMLKISARVDVIQTSNYSSWQLFSLMSKYRAIETNGSSLAFWVSVLADSHLITSNLEHQKIYDYLKNNI